MWFLSYLREGSSTASNTDIQRAAKRRKKADAEDENAPTQLPLPSHFFIEAAPVNMCNACVHTRANAHTHTHTSLSARARRHITSTAANGEDAVKSLQPVTGKKTVL